MTGNKFYVYALLDPRKSGQYEYGEFSFDYEPFYIGKGSGRRTHNHCNKSRLSQKTAKICKINKILSQNLKPIVLIICSELTEDQSFQLKKI